MAFANHEPVSAVDDLAAVYAVHSAWLARLATALVGQRDAEDLVHETLERSLRRLPGLNRDAQRAYLRTVLVNRARSRFRRQAVARRFVPERALTSASAEDVAVGEIERQRLAEAVDRLPARQRASVVLRFYEQLPDDVVAATLGISRRSLRTHLERALATLSTQITKER